MKYAVIILSLALSGCQLLQPENMLDTAPKSDFEVANPDWGVVEQPKNVVAEPVIATNFGKTIPMNDALEAFLQQHRIDYERIPGEHVMLKLTEHVNFNTGSSSLSSMSNRWLDLLGDYLSKRSDVEIVVEGHTDSTGSYAVNDVLSEKRAMRIKTHLERQRVGSNTIYTRGYGEYVPACDNMTKQGRACNRRAEVILIVTR
ncbi:OmpA family protein [Vibrio sp. T187]|uniref:OmpA family protein n=1 Tax=Vibrio TaxID=662 RepID=UPI0010C9DB8F|nr:MULTISPECIES: OmpA family protein [Vibrio]MBW3696054.1 OmpA family protein [Vibrio sp. T187]